MKFLYVYENILDFCFQQCIVGNLNFKWALSPALSLRAFKCLMLFLWNVKCVQQEILVNHINLIFSHLHSRRTSIHLSFSLLLQLISLPLCLLSYSYLFLNIVVFVVIDFILSTFSETISNIIYF